MGKILCLLLALFVLLVACEKGTRIHNANIAGCVNINLDELEQRDYLLFSEIYNKVGVVALSDCVVVGRISQVLLHNDEIFVLDQMSTRVFIFDRSGRFLRQIGSRGQGPGELHEASSITIDRERSHLYILDAFAQRINKYDIVDGRFLSSISLEPPNTWAAHIHYHNNRLFLTQFSLGPRRANYLFKVLPLDEGCVDFIVPISFNMGWNQPEQVNMTGPFFIKSDGSLLFSHQFMSVVFGYSEHQLTPYIVLSGDARSFFTSRLLSSIVDDNRLSLNAHIIMSQNRYWNISNFIDTDDFVFFNIWRGLRIAHVFYCKNSSSAKKFDTFYEDLFLSRVPIHRINIHFGGRDGRTVFYFVQSGHSEFTAGRGVNSIADKVLLSYYQEFLNDDDRFNGLILFYELK